MNADEKTEFSKAVDYQSPDVAQRSGSRAELLLALPGVFAFFVFAIVLFAFTVGERTEFVHKATGAWIDWGRIFRTAMTASLIMTSVALPMIYVLFRPPRSKAIQLCLLWNWLGFAPHAFIYLTCAGIGYAWSHGW